MCAILFGVALASVCHAQRGEFLTVENFLDLAFPEASPVMETLWLDNSQRQVAAGILRHEFSALRVRYWHDRNRTAWILDEIGKENPITFGVVVEENQIKDIQVLTYRESRGGEIRYPFFTQQFLGLFLRQSEIQQSRVQQAQAQQSQVQQSQIQQSQQIPQLSSSIDGITGATLSVRAMRKIATLALFFHQHHGSKATVTARYEEG